MAGTVVFVLCVCGVVAFIDRQIINLLVEDIKADLLVSDTQISLLQGLCLCGLLRACGDSAGANRRQHQPAPADHGRNLRLDGCRHLLRPGADLCPAFLRPDDGGLWARRYLRPRAFPCWPTYSGPGGWRDPSASFTASSFFGSGIALMVGGYIVNAIQAADGISLPFFGPLRLWQAVFILGALPGIPAAIWFFLSVREPPRRAAPPSLQSSREYRRGFLEAMRYVGNNRRLFLSIYAGHFVPGRGPVRTGRPGFRRTSFARMAGRRETSATPRASCSSFAPRSAWWGAVGLRTPCRRAAIATPISRPPRSAGCWQFPFAVAIPLASDPMVAVSLLAPAVLFGAIPFGGGVAALPMVSPPQFRAQLVAFYLLVANILGQAGGPWLVAQFTDRVFADDAAVGWSLMISVPLLLAIGSLLTLSGWRALARATGRRIGLDGTLIQYRSVQGCAQGHLQVILAGAEVLGERHRNDGVFRIDEIRGVGEDRPT